MWFLLNPLRKAPIHVENVDDFKLLISSNFPVLRQLESAATKEYYFNADHSTTLSSRSSNLKYINPKYLSMLNHLRFYLPQVYPKLDKILFWDDDIVVQKDLTPLWSVDLHGKINGSVGTCGESFHRFDKYLDFSNPHIARHFDPIAYGWAYGMNVFDLKELKKEDITEIYHKWQNMESEKHVFHLITDKLNFGAMKMWFLLNPSGKAMIHVENVDDFKRLNSSYCPMLRQLESVAMKEYYFKADHSTTLSSHYSDLKYIDPKYLSMLNHLRFYLPQVYPKLDKILFWDDDNVVQKDFMPLWSVDLHVKVNGSVETCGESFRQFDKYLSFSKLHIARHFDPNAYGWAYGMNIFDLKEWEKQDITGIYHKW